MTIPLTDEQKAIRKLASVMSKESFDYLRKDNITTLRSNRLALCSRRATLRATSYVCVTTVAPVFETTGIAMHYPNLSKWVSGAGRVRLIYELLLITINVA